MNVLKWCIVIALLFFFLPVVVYLWPLAVSILLVYSFKKVSRFLKAKKASDDAELRRGASTTPPPFVPAVQNTSNRLVDSEYDSLAFYGKVTFRNIVLDSRGGNTPHTEIDEVIVSPYGIFCIEYKSHKGIIFGDEKDSHWTQCLTKNRYSFYNPLRQNYKHVRALEDLLEGRLRAPIYSYAVFTDAHQVHVKSNRVFGSPAAMYLEISKQQKRVYSLGEVDAIAKKLELAQQKGADLLPMHVQEVQQYLAAMPLRAIATK